MAGDAISLDQKLNEPLPMQKYGGLNKELVVQETDQDAIRYAIIDYTRMIWRSQAYGQTQRNNNKQQLRAGTHGD